MKNIEIVIEKAMYRSRWLLAPIYLGLSFALLAGAGVLSSPFRQLAADDLGVDLDGLYTLRGDGYPEDGAIAVVPEPNGLIVNVGDLKPMELPTSFFLDYAWNPDANFYCPGDQKVYLDLSFLNQLRQLGAPGDFAFAYVIAHEVAHHVQKLLGFSTIVDRIRQKGDKLATNHASVRLELQADFLAGVFAHHADDQFDFLETGDIEEAMNCARAVPWLSSVPVNPWKM